MTRSVFERLTAREFAGAVLALVLSCSTNAAVAQGDSQQAYRVDDRVELHIAGPHWQRCRVTENNPVGLMRGLCEEYVEPAPGTYRRAAGTYILSRGDVRPVGTTAAPEPQTPRSGAGSLSGRAADKVVAGASFAIGDKVEIEASNHWVPCVVAENKPPSIMRVRCEAYPRLSRDAGLYTVDRDNPQAVRKATGATGPIVAPAAKPAPRPGAAGGAGLKLGEYACYGSRPCENRNSRR